MKLYPTLLTGEVQEQLLESRTKEVAVLAGPSPPLEPLKVSTRLKLDLSSPSLSNSWLIALE